MGWRAEHERMISADGGEKYWPSDQLQLDPCLERQSFFWARFEQAAWRWSLSPWGAVLLIESDGTTRVDLGKYTVGVGELAGFNVASSCSCSLPIGADSQRCGLSECPSSTAIRPDSWDEVSDES